MTIVKQTNLVSQFQCLGEQCEDTCCSKWSMQVDEKTADRYRTNAPELLDAIETATEAPWIMRKDPSTGFCIKLEDGLCGIHKKYGSDFLGDACHFYPRITRSLGEHTLVTASTSCPQVVRLMLEDTQSNEWKNTNIERLPTSLKDYLPAGITQDEALSMHEAFLSTAQDTSINAEHSMLRIASASRSLERLEIAQWPIMTDFYLKNADMRLPPPHPNPADPFNLLHALCGLIIASQKPASPRLMQTIKEMELSLGVQLDWSNANIALSDDSVASYLTLQNLWHNINEHYEPILRRWLQMQLSMALYPFGGLGQNNVERVTIIGVRLATLKLALMCAHNVHGDFLPNDTIIRIIQSLSRFLDHLGDISFSMQIFTETGWLQEDRLRGLLEA